MPLDARVFKSEKEFDSFNQQRIYVCETGEVRLETGHFRRDFAPEEFIDLLREIIYKEKT